MRVPFSASRCATSAGQRQIDVVAAQQDVLAHRDAFERQLAPRFGHRDQGEIGGAAADIDHQDQIAHLHALAPVGVPLDPGIEGGLRLFEQGDVLVAGLFARLRASARAPRRRTMRAPSPAPAARRTARPASGNPRPRADAPGSGGWPPPAKASPRLRARGRAAAARCGPRRNARARIWRRTPAARRSPRRASAPAGRPRSRGSASQGRASGARREIGGAGHIEERGQQVFLAHLARIYQLRHGQQAHVGREQTGPPPRRRSAKASAELVVPKSIPMTYCGSIISGVGDWGLGSGPNFGAEPVIPYPQPLIP